MRFALNGDELVLTLQGHQTHLTRTGRSDTPVATPSVTVNTNEPVWIVGSALAYNHVGYSYTLGFYATYEEYGEMYKI